MRPICSSALACGVCDGSGGRWPFGDRYETIPESLRLPEDWLMCGVCHGTGYAEVIEVTKRDWFNLDGTPDGTSLSHDWRPKSEGMYLVVPLEQGK